MGREGRERERREIGSKKRTRRILREKKERVEACWFPHNVGKPGERGIEIDR